MAAPAKSRLRRRGRWVRWLVDGLIVILAAFVALAGYLYWRARRTEPQRDGAVHLAGLSAPAEIVRDEYGVAHIRAANIADLYLAEGYAMAQDRLWQMDFLRRLAEGRLAAIFGPVALPMDRQTLKLGLPRIAAREARQMDPLNRRLLAAFSQGINDYMRRQSGRLPLEFRLLGYRPGPWRARDSLAIAAQMYRTLSMTYSDELEREIFARKVSPAALAVLFPAGSPWDLPPARQSMPGVTGLPAMARARRLPPPGRGSESRARRAAAELAALAALLHALPQAPPSVANVGAGSNNWVLGPTRVSTGKPVLANDPHLRYQVPGLFWAVTLSAPDLHAAGAAIAGAPGIIIGHNRHIAWGMTNVGADVQDLYQEQIRGRQVLTPRGWRPVRVLRYRIAVKGRPAVAFQVRLTPRGPIVARDPVTHQPLALAWSLYSPGSLRGEFGVFLQLEQAKNWEEFRAALARFPGPAQNFVYADTAGNIGYQCAARIPIRRTGRGRTPVPGADARYGWKGWIPFSQLPRVYDPANQILVTANGRITPRGYPYPIANHWYGPFRTQRIYQLLTSRPRWTPGGMSAVQMDTVSLPARFIARALVRAGRHDPAAVTPAMRPALRRLAHFDGDMSRDRVAPTLAELTQAAFVRRVVAAQAGAELAKRYHWKSAAVLAREWLTERPRAWLPPAYRKNGWNALLLACLRSVVGDSQLTGRRWRWGRHAMLYVPQLVYSHIPLLSGYADLGPVELNGSADTINRTTGTVGPCLRFVADLADWDRSKLTLFAGENGEPFGGHYRDQFPHYLSGNPVPLWFSRAAVTRHAVHQLRLLP